MKIIGSKGLWACPAVCAVEKKIHKDGCKGSSAKQTLHLSPFKWTTLDNTYGQLAYTAYYIYVLYVN